MGERIRRVKVRKLVGWDKDSLTGKAKAVHTRKAKQGICSLLPIVRQVCSHLQESRAPSRVTPSLRTCPPPSSFFLQLLFLSMTSYGVKYPFGQLGSAVPAVSPPSFPCTPSLLTGGVEWEAERALTLCKHCSAITKPSLCYQQCFQHKSKTHKSHTGFYGEN